MGLHYLQRGLSLTEILATLAIAAVTATLAVPAMNGLVADNQRSARLNEFVSTLHAARSQAITRNQQVTLCPSRSAVECDDAQWHEGLIWFVDLDKDRRFDTEDTLLGALDAFERGVIRSAEFDAFVAYQPNGRIQAESSADLAGEWLICDLHHVGDSRILTLSAGGKPRLVSGIDPERFADCESP